LSSSPFAFSRATWTLPPSGPEKPAISSLPFGVTTTAWARPIGPQLKSFLPSPSKLASSEPLDFSPTTATRKFESPASTILPSAWSAPPYAESLSPPKSTTRLPPDPNVVSSVPFVRRRTTQNEPPAAPPPATTIRPLGCTSTTRAASVPPKLIVFLPPLPKVVSNAPGFAMGRP
jgi:hypothetical protein